MAKYFDEVVRAMRWLSEQKDTIFLGQAVAYKGNVIYKTLADVPSEKKIEMPVFEDTQMGMSLGLALEGYVPVSVFPRYNFLLLAFNQLINHIDKTPVISKGGFKPKVIVKTMIGSKVPLDPGVQHKSDFTNGLAMMVDTVRVERLSSAGMVFDAYRRAYEADHSTVIAEYGDLY